MKEQAHGKEFDFSKEMKKRQFVEYHDGYVRKFTFVKELEGKIYVGHKINNTVGRLTEVKFNDMDSVISNFDRI